MGVLVKKVGQAKGVWACGPMNKKGNNVEIETHFMRVESTTGPVFGAARDTTDLLLFYSEPGLSSYASQSAPYNT